MSTKYIVNGVIYEDAEYGTKTIAGAGVVDGIPNRVRTLRATAVNSSLTRASNLVTVVHDGACNVLAGDTIVVAGVTPSTFNGRYTVASRVSATSYTYAQTGADESATAMGTSGGDYETMSAWQSAEKTDLVALNASHTLECYNDWPSGLVESSNGVTVSGWTTSATNTITIKAADGHDHGGSATVGDGFSMIVSGGPGRMVLSQGNLTVEGILVKSTGSGGSTRPLEFSYYSANPIVVKNCVLIQSASNSASVVGMPTSTTPYFDLINCLSISNNAGGGIGLDQNSSRQRILNCTFIGNGSGTGIAGKRTGGSALIHIKNTAIYGFASSIGFTSGDDSPNIEYLAVDDDRADLYSTTTTGINYITAADFKLFNSGHYEPAENGVLYNAGTDTGISTDITGAPLDGVFSIGAFKHNSYPIIESVKNYYA